MKKIFTFIFVLFIASASVFAQSLTVSYEGNPVNNGDTIEVIVPQLNSTLDVYLDLSNVSEEDVTVRVHKYELDMVNEATAAMCFGDACYPPTTTTSGSVFIMSGSTLSHESSEGAFHFSYKTPAAGISYVKFVFVNEENEEDQVSVVFKMVCNPTGIVSNAVATKMRAYPNPASEIVTVEYAYTGNTSNVNLVIKNLVGATLYTKKLDVNGNKVRVDVSEYNAGIYFYSIEADGRPLVTKKLLVK